MRGLIGTQDSLKEILVFSASSVVRSPPTVSASQVKRGKIKTSATVSGYNVNDSILHDNPVINLSEVEPQLDSRTQANQNRESTQHNQLCCVFMFGTH